VALSTRETSREQTFTSQALLRPIRAVGRNHYILNFDAITAIPGAEVILKRTPRTRGANLNKRARKSASAQKGVDTPALADNTPAVEGVNAPARKGA
jgi:hypothetical protein